MYDMDKGMYDYAEWDCCDDPDTVLDDDGYVCVACGESFKGRTYLTAGGYLMVSPRRDVENGQVCKVILPGGWLQKCCWHDTTHGKGLRCCQCARYKSGEVNPRYPNYLQY